MAVDGSLNFNTELDSKGFSKDLKAISANAEKNMREIASYILASMSDIEDAIYNTSGYASKEAEKASEKSKGHIKSAIGEIKSELTGLMKKIAVAFSIKEGISFSKAAVETAASVNALNSQISQTFGELEGNARQSFNEIGDEAGILDSRLQSAGSSIYAFAKASGMESAEALSMMEDALRITADSAAYYDRSLEDTAESLRSFLKGNYANDAALGVSATEATRNAAAMRLYGTEFKNLSEAQKQLALLDMVKQANELSGAEGQAAREAEGWENVTGNLKEAWKQFLAVVGQPILSVATKVVQGLTTALAELTSYAEAAAGAVASLFGIELQSSAQAVSDIAKAADKTASAYSDIADEAERAEEAQEGSLASFDKVIKLDEKESSSSSSAGSGGGVAVTPITFDTKATQKDMCKLTGSLKKELKKLSDFIKKNFGPSFDKIWDGLKEETAELSDTLGRVFSDIQSLGDPLKTYFSNDLVPNLRTAFDTLGSIGVGLFDSFNKVFADIWDIAVFPILQNFVTLGLPMLTQFSTESWNTLNTLFDIIKTGFDTFWADVVQSVLSGVETLVDDTLQSLWDFWETWGAPIFEDAREALEATGELVGTVWDEWIKPVWDECCELASALWDDHLKPLLDNILDFFGELVDGALRIYNKCIAPLISWVVDKLAPIITATFKELARAIAKIIQFFTDIFNGLITTLKGLVKFIVGVFTGDWKKAWNGIKDIFKGIWDMFVTIVKTPINLIIGLINGMTGAIESALNWIIEKINYLSFDVPDWVPVIGGEHFGFDLSYIDIPEIPYLAQGTVVPANYGEFAAILGDNKKEPEVVSPISAMKQAFREALSEYHGSGQQMVLNVMLDTRRGRKLLSQQVIDDINDIINSTGAVPINL